MKALLSTLFATAITMSAVSQTSDCSDLFITEVVFENPLSALPAQGSQSTVDHKNVIELFNPTEIDINLSNYSLVLTPENGSPIVQNLYGTIESKKTGLISNFNSNSDITSVAKVVSTLMDFSGKVQIELKNNGTPIDRIGQTGANDPMVIDMNELLSNPVYLDGQEIDLTSIQNLSVRRNVGVTKGNLVFDPEILVQEWSVFPNNVLDDLGSYQGACAVPLFYLVIDENSNNPYTAPGDQGTAYENEGNNLSASLYYWNPNYSSAWDNFAFDYRYTIDYNNSTATLNQDYTLESDAEDWHAYPFCQQVHGNPYNGPYTPWLRWNKLHLINDGISEPTETIDIEVEVDNIVGIPSGVNNFLDPDVGPPVFFTVLNGETIIGVDKYEDNLNEIPTIQDQSELNLANYGFDNIKEILITNLNGQIIHRESSNSITFGSLSSNYYLLVVKTENGIYSKKILKI